MRALYTDDIQGAKPTIRYYDRSLIRYKHIEEMERFGNKDKRIIDWYKPIPRHVEPMENEKFPLKTSFYNPNTNEHLTPRLSPSKRVSAVAPKITQRQISKSVVLSQSGLKSISSKELDVSPYFPHKYRDFDREYPNKWSGNREWNQEFKQTVPIPTVDKQYFPKWGPDLLNK